MIKLQCRRCQRCVFNPWVEKIPWRRKWQPTPVFLTRKTHAQRTPGGYGPWGHKESDMTEHSCMCDKTNINMDCSVIIANFTQNDSYLNP